MAEKAHCFFCFEVLSSSYSKKPTLSLSQVEEAVHNLQLHKSSLTNGNSVNGTNGTTTNGTSVNGHSATNGVSRPERPLFVTWNLLKHGDKQLRGCIGTFSNFELEGGLKTYALTAAFDDTRFNPIDKKELPDLECAVSVLTDFEPAADVFDWTLGVHGLRISFTYHSRRLSATYLPDVPVEQGWNQEKTLVSLMRKAGWGGKTADWQKVDVQVTRYKGTKASATWKEYKELKEFLEKV
ncbi:hypothetical protein H072_2565 [Dactylellina haptotyla CBS 200.50]|uniref:AMMECR1 domain-containing protein n=1 Tax=Dactylellina haptotyla (strain CBS 200.50) TaxID=1284197 RepID=S8AKG8_DACHA|nr:hypothetical protein H072_2565 [Dactylellina haptotyla CBS 200.50]